MTICKTKRDDYDCGLEPYHKELEHFICLGCFFTTEAKYDLPVWPTGGVTWHASRATDSPNSGTSPPFLSGVHRLFPRNNEKKEAGILAGDRNPWSYQLFKNLFPDVSSLHSLSAKMQLVTGGTKSPRTSRAGVPGCVFGRLGQITICFLSDTGSVGRSHLKITL